MKSKFNAVMSKLFHDMAIAELRIQNYDYSSNKLTYNSILYLDIIDAHPGEYTASNIADMLHVARPSVTQKLNELEKMGYITKKRSKTDKRIYYLYVSKNAFSDVTMRTYANAEDKAFRKLADQYSNEEIDKFFEMLSFVGDAYLKGIDDNDSVNDAGECL